MFKNYSVVIRFTDRKSLERALNYFDSIFSENHTITYADLLTWEKHQKHAVKEIKKTVVSPGPWSSSVIEDVLKVKTGLFGHTISFL